MPREQISLLQQVYCVARDAHKEQIRSSGEPYITHPVAVACILAQMKLDYETLMAALLHDVIEDTTATYQDMEKLFGEKVANLVEGVSKLDKLKFRDKKEAQAENFRKMVMAMVRDLRVILIKLADRTHNMRTLYALPTEKKRRIALETLEIYIPLAHRLGIFYLKTELEELSFKTLYPNSFRIIKEIVQAIHNNKKKTIQKIILQIDNHLQKHGIISRIIGRKKSLYEIYSKIKLKEKSIISIMDIYDFHIIVKDLDTCYLTLSKIHTLYKPFPGKVKDYITIPKTNGYQSLHTSMMGPYGIPVEIQIRTEDMDQIAKIGVVAHWNSNEHEKNITTTQIHAQQWLQRLLELQQSTINSFEFIENVKYDLFLEQFYFMQPKELIIESQSNRKPFKNYLLVRFILSRQTIKIINNLNNYLNIKRLEFVIRLKGKTKIYHLLKIFKQEELINLYNHKLNNVKKINNIPLEKGFKLNLKHINFKSFIDLLVEIELTNIINIVFIKNILYNIRNFLIQKIKKIIQYLF